MLGKKLSYMVNCIRKGGSYMVWIERMNSALNYVEEHLLDELNYARVAQLACCSFSSFQRMFSVMANVSLFEYIRRRKLTLAAFELQNSAIKVVDLASKYGYESPEAFTRAFNQLHGISPSSAREKGANLTAYPRISFTLTVKGVVPMNYKIVEKDAFEIYGLESLVNTEDDEHLKTIPELWQKAIKDGSLHALAKSTGITGHDDHLACVNAICDYREVEEDKTYPYMLFAHKTAKSDATGYKVVTVPAATWVIFRSENHTIEQTSSVIQQLFQRVYTEWLPTAQYDKDTGCELEMYYQQGETYWSEVWIRVTPKA